MTRKLILVVAVSGITLLGVIFTYAPDNDRSNLAEIGEIQQQTQTESPLIPTPTKIKQTPEPFLSPAVTPVILTPSPIIIYVTVTPTLPTPATLTHQSASPQPSTIPVETTAYTESGSTLSPAPPSQNSTNHIFYTSSHWKAKYYYCDTDDGWKDLSSTYLKSFNSEEELLKNYSRILHEPCK